MRALLLIILGLAIGSVASVMIVNALHLRSAYPRGVMAIQQHHMAVMKRAIRRGACPARANRLQLTRLHAVDAEIVPAFSGPHGAIDAPFKTDARQLQNTVAAALHSDPENCGELAASVQRIEQRCTDCHRHYR